VLPSTEKPIIPKEEIITKQKTPEGFKTTGDKFEVGQRAIKLKDGTVVFDDSPLHALQINKLKAAGIDISEIESGGFIRADGSYIKGSEDTPGIIAKEMAQKKAELAKEADVLADKDIKIEDKPTKLEKKFPEQFSLQEDREVREASEKGFKGNLPFEAVEWNQAIKKFGKEGMTKEARMSRAKEQGYDTDTVYYHGSGNIENISKKGFDSALTGKGVDQLGSGFYFTTDPSEASLYATSVTPRVPKGTRKLGGDESPGVIPVYLNIKNPLIINGSSLRDVDIDLNEDQAFEIIKNSESVRDLEESIIWNFMDISGYDSIEDWMLQDVASNYTGSSLINLENDFFSDESTNFRGAINKVLGYDGVIMNFENKDHKIAWFPEQIRSINAAFDPEFKKSPNLLLSLDDKPRGQSLSTDKKTTYTKEAIEKAIAKPLSKINEKLGVKVNVISFNEIPESTKRNIPAGRRPKAYVKGNNIFLVHDNIKDDKDALVTLAHELKGHVGTNGIIGKNNWSKVVPLYRELKKVGGDRFNTIKAELDKRYGDLNEESELKEFIAIAAEHREKEGVVGKFMRKVREYFNAGLRIIGISKPIGMSDIDIILTRSEQFLREGAVPLSEITLTREVKKKDGTIQIASVKAENVLRQTRKKRDMVLNLLRCVNG
jgi:hypothetical protein